MQRSNLRIFPDDAYSDVGAELTEDLSPADVILAVKEVPIPLILPNRTYMFFSHTIKAQKKNMPLLDALLAKRVRLVDYECITVGGHRGGKRLVAFGRYAGELFFSTIVTDSNFSITFNDFSRYCRYG